MVCGKGLKTLSDHSPVRPQETEDWSLERGSNPQSFWQIGREFPPSLGARGDWKQGRGSGSSRQLPPPLLTFPFLGVSHLCWPLLGPSSPLPTHHAGCSGGWGQSRASVPSQLLGECGFSPQRQDPLFSCRLPGSLGFGTAILRPSPLRDRPQTHMCSHSGLLLGQGPFPGSFSARPH